MAKQRKSKKVKARGDDRARFAVGTKLNRDDYEAWMSVVPNRQQSPLVEAFTRMWPRLSESTRISVLEYIGAQRALGKEVDGRKILSLLTGKRK